MSPSRRSYMFLVAAVLSLHCSSSNTTDSSNGSGNGGGGGTTGSDAGATSGPPSTKFASAEITWPVPSAGTPFGYGRTSDLNAEGPDFSTFDIDGDKKPDLVVTRKKGDSGVSGGDANAFWRVYKNNGAGFDTNELKWPVPSAGTPFGYGRTSDLNADGPDFSTFDIDGDGKPDLVVTRKKGDSGVSGGDANAFWRVYKNNGAGFDANELKWPVPSSGTPFGYGRTSDLNAEGPDFSTFDIDGDGKPDLVVTRKKGDSGVSGGDANAFWRVYKNNGAGFDANELKWPVPSAGTPFGYGRTSDLNAEGPDFSTFDIDGDKKPDLVVTRKKGDNGVSGGDANAFWRVYKNNGAGFDANELKWPVPSAGTPFGYGRTSDLNAEGPDFSTFDLNGDGKPDLVVTRKKGDNGVSGGDANAFWRVYRNTGTGFAAEATWSVPSAGTPFGYGRTSDLNAEGPDFSTFDLNGDGKPDLVVTRKKGDNGVSGGDANAHWNVFYGEP